MTDEKDFCISLSTAGHTSVVTVQPQGTYEGVRQLMFSLNNMDTFDHVTVLTNSANLKTLAENILQYLDEEEK